MATVPRILVYLGLTVLTLRAGVWGWVASLPNNPLRAYAWIGCFLILACIGALRPWKINKIRPLTLHFIVISIALLLDSWAFETYTARVRKLTEASGLEIVEFKTEFCDSHNDGRLGAKLTPYSADGQNYLGLFITEIEESAPLFEAGLRRGDIIVGVGSEKIASDGSSDQLQYLCANPNSLTYLKDPAR